MPKIKCNNCEERVEEVTTAVALRAGGGNYRRPPRNYRSRICRSCIEGLLKSIAPPGRWTVDRWDVTSLKYALKLVSAKASDA